MQTYSITPFIIFGAAKGLLFGYLTFKCPSGVKRVTGLAVATLLVFPGAFLALAKYEQYLDPRYRAFRAFYNSIEVGMTKEDVFDLIKKHYSTSSKRRAPIILENTQNRLKFFMNPEAKTEPNCEGIFLKILENRVTEKEYSPD